MCVKWRVDSKLEWHLNETTTSSSFFVPIPIAWSNWPRLEIPKHPPPQHPETTRFVEIGAQVNMTPPSLMIPWLNVLNVFIFKLPPTIVWLWLTSRTKSNNTTMVYVCLLQLIRTTTWATIRVVSPSLHWCLAILITRWGLARGLRTKRKANPLRVHLHDSRSLSMSGVKYDVIVMSQHVTTLFIDHQPTPATS